MKTIRFNLNNSELFQAPARCLVSILPVLDSDTNNLLGGARIDAAATEIFLAGSRNPFAEYYEAGIPFFIYPVLNVDDEVVALEVSEVAEAVGCEVRKR